MFAFEFYEYKCKWSTVNHLNEKVKLTFVRFTILLFDFDWNQTFYI